MFISWLDWIFARKKNWRGFHPISSQTVDGPRKRTFQLTIELLEDRCLLAWAPIGPAPQLGHWVGTVSGRATALAIPAIGNPAQQVILLGSDGGGVWRNTSLDVANDWQPMTDNKINELRPLFFLNADDASTTTVTVSTRGSDPVAVVHPSSRSTVVSAVSDCPRNAPLGLKSAAYSKRPNWLHHKALPAICSDFPGNYCAFFKIMLDRAG